MMRRRRAANGITLFPFLSVLACVIGTLTLLISGLALGEIGSTYLEEIRLEEEVVRLTERVERRGAEAALLRTGIAASEAKIEPLLRIRGEVGRWKERQREAARLSTALIEEREQLGVLISRQPDLEAEVLYLEEQVALLERRLAQEQRTLAEAGKSVQLRPTGSGAGLVTRFIECTENALVIDPDRPAEQRRIVRGLDLGESAVLVHLFQQIRSREQQILVFLVRPDSVPVFMVARDLALEHDVLHGAMPVPTQRPLDFSLFRGDQQER